MSRPEDGDGADAPADFVDARFRIEAGTVPVDHAWLLERELSAFLPWLRDEPDAGIHPIHVAASGNGWRRPPADRGGVLNVSRRTRLGLRIPLSRIPDLGPLSGRRLDLGGHAVDVGALATRKLAPASTLFARYVACTPGETESGLVDRIAGTLHACGVEPRRILCGMTASIRAPAGALGTRSVLIAELRPDESLVVQCRGLGPHRRLGCGLFVPHRGIAAVAEG